MLKGRKVSFYILGCRFLFLVNTIYPEISKLRLPFRGHKISKCEDVAGRIV